jgi:predicted Zn-dependent peptidase
MCAQSPRFEIGRTAAGIPILCEAIAPQRLAHVSLWIRGGSRQEFTGTYGASHALEHLAVRRAPQFTWQGLVERAGGSFNAVTDREFLAFYYSAPAEFAAECLPAFLDQLPVATRTFSAEDYETETSVLAEEWRHFGTDPIGYLLAGLQERLLPGQLRHYPGGTEDDLDLLTADAVAGVAHRLWTPSEIAIVVSGLSPELVLELADRSALSELSDGAADAGQAVADRERACFEFADPATMEADIPILQGIGWTGPGCTDPTLAATEVAVSLLAGGSSSRLYQVVRGEHGLAYGVDGWHIAYSDAGLSNVLVQTSAEHAGLVERLVDTEIEKLIEQPVSDDELETAQRRLVGQRFQLWEDGIERVFAAGRAQFIPTEATGDLASWARACFDVRPDEVAAAAAGFLNRRVVCHA